MPVNISFRARAYAPPGTLIRAAGLPERTWPPGTAAAFRVAYHSAARDGGPRLVTGAVCLPEGDPPAGGWPVVSYARGTTGISHVGTPSLTGLFPAERAHAGQWLDRGFAVAATDFEGLGGRGGHPHFDGRHEAWDLTDIVRAARQLSYPVGRDWIVAGFSQGAHAALFTAQTATAYAPDLDYRACVALAPPAGLRKLWTSMADFDRPELAPLLEYVLGGLAATRPDLSPDDLLTGKGYRLLRAAHRGGPLGMSRGGADPGPARVEGRKPTTAAQIRAALSRDAIPFGRFDRPVYLGQGLADEVAAPGGAGELAAELRSAGAALTRAAFDGEDHAGVLAAAQPSVADWARALLAGAEPPASVPPQRGAPRYPSYRATPAFDQ